MTIKVSCSCGRTYRVPRDLMGSRLTCVECKQAIVIPRPGGTKPTQFPPTQPPGPTKSKQPSGGSLIQPVRPPSPPSPPEARPRGSASRRRLAYGLGASGAAVGLVILLVMALSGGKQNPEPVETDDPGVAKTPGNGTQDADDPESGDPSNVQHGFPIQSIAEDQHLARAVGLVVCGWKGVDQQGEAFEQLGLPPVIHKKSELDNLAADEKQRLARDKDGELVERVVEGEVVVYESLGASMGSCFIVSPDGSAITNKHVVEKHQRLGRNSEKLEHFKRLGKFKELRATFWVFVGNRPYECQVVHVSSRYDLAILKLPLEDCHFFRLYDSTDLNRGLDVVAMGFPGAADEVPSEGQSARDAKRPARFRATGIREFFDQSQLVYSHTEGKVSRVVQWSEIGRVVQHNADINPGNSGGPLTTRHGLVLGVNTWGMREAGIHSSLIIKQLRDEINSNTRGVIWSDELD